MSPHCCLSLVGDCFSLSPCQRCSAHCPSPSRTIIQITSMPTINSAQDQYPSENSYNYNSRLRHLKQILISTNISLSYFFRDSTSRATNLSKWKVLVPPMLVWSMGGDDYSLQSIYYLVANKTSQLGTNLIGLQGVKIPSGLPYGAQPPPTISLVAFLQWGQCVEW